MTPHNCIGDSDGVDIRSLNIDIVRMSFLSFLFSVSENSKHDHRRLIMNLLWQLILIKEWTRVKFSAVTSITEYPSLVGYT